MKSFNSIFRFFILFCCTINIFAQSTSENHSDNSGRALLVGFSTAAGAGYGATFQTLFDIENERALVGTYFLSTAAGFGTSFALTQNKNVSLPAATLAVGGQTLGYVDGIALSLLLGRDLENGPDTKLLTTLGMTSSIGQTILGYRYAKKQNLTLGRSSLINIGHIWGLGYGVGFSQLFGFFEDNKEGYIRGTGATLLLSSMAGTAAGALLMPNKYYTNGDAIVIQTLGMIGGYLPIGFVEAAEPESDKVYTSAMMLSSAVGLGLGTYLLPEQNFTSSQGLLISLGTVAGGLFALGTTYVLSNDETDSSVYLITSSLGSIAGFTGMYKLFGNKKKIGKNEKVGYQFQVYPQHFMANKQGKNQEMTKQNLENAMPLASLNLTF